MLDDLLGGLIGWAIGDRIIDRRAKKLGQTSKTECGLRVVAGSHPGLTSKWRHGTAQLAPGLIRLDSTSVRVESIDRSVARRPSGREAWSASPRTEIVQVRVGGAVLEWAVLRERLDWAVEQVQA